MPLPNNVARWAFLNLAGGLPLVGLSHQAPGTAPAGKQPVALQPEDGELFFVGPTRDPVRIKVSPSPQGRFAMIVQDMAPGSRVPIHLHEKEDEIIFIQRGTGRASVGGQTVTLRPGAALFVPQGTWHGGENSGSDTLVWVAIYSPSGFEGYFREIGIGPKGEMPPQLTPDERDARDRRYGIRYPG